MNNETFEDEYVGNPTYVDWSTEQEDLYYPLEEVWIDAWEGKVFQD